MAIDYTRNDFPGLCYRYNWTVIPQDDEGVPISIPGASDRTVQVVGTFNGAAVTFEASLDNSNWFTCTDLQGNAISMTSAGAEFITENAVHYKPVVTGGDGDTSITVYMLSRNTR